MQNLTSILPILTMGMAILMAGILLTRTQHDSFRSAISEGLFWNAGLFLCFSIEVLIFEKAIV